MPFSYLDILIIVLSAGGIFLIIARKIPLVVALDNAKEKEKTGTSLIIDNMAVIKDKSFFKFKVKIEYRKSIIKFACFLEKILRRLRLSILRIDNLFNRWIGILRENTKSNTKNLTIEKGKFFDYKMGKFREAAQKWQSHAFHMIEDGVEKSLVMITPDAGRNKKVIAKNQAEKSQKTWTFQDLKKAKPFKMPERLQMTEKNRPSSVVEQKSVTEVPPEEVFEPEKAYIERIAKNPRDVESYRKLGRLYMIQKNYGDALASFMEIVKNKKDDIEAQNMILKINDLVKNNKG